MKIRITFLLLFIAFQMHATETSDVSYSAHVISNDLKENANAVIRHETLDFDVQSISSAKETFQRTVTLMDESSDYNEFYVHYSKFAKVVDISATIYDANGRLIRKIKKSEIIDHSAVSGYSLYEDDRFKYIKAVHNTYPYTVVFSYTKTWRTLFLFPDWNVQTRYKTSVEKSECKITMPAGIKLQYLGVNMDSKPQSSGVVKNKTIYQWSATNLKAIESEPFAPSRGSLFPSIKFAPTSFTLDTYQGNMESWETLGKFFYDLNRQNENLPPELKTKVHTLVADAKTDEEKVSILYQYMQKNTRYVSVQLGVGGWQSFPPSYVEKNQYGDCKALTYYMRAMLEEVGITAYPALIRSSRSGYVLPKDFSYPAFNHVILYVPKADEKPIWLECTSSYKPVGYIGQSNENREVLLVKPEGGEVIKTPHKGKEEHQQVQTAVVQLNNTGGAKVTTTSINYNNEHDGLRYMYHDATKEEQKKTLQEWFRLPTFTIESFDIKLYNDQPRADLLYTLDIPKYATQMGKRIFLKPNLLNRRSKIPTSIENRIHPIVRRLGYTHIDTIRFQLPDAYEIENLPHDDFKVESDFGSYHITAKLVGNELVYTRHLEMPAFSFPKERYEDLRAFYAQIVKTDNMKMVLVRNKP